MMMVDGVRMYDMGASVRNRLVHDDGRMVVSYAVVPMMISEYDTLLTEDDSFAGHQMWQVELEYTDADEGDGYWTVSVIPVTVSGLSWLDKAYEISTYEDKDDAVRAYMNRISSYI